MRRKKRVDYEHRQIPTPPEKINSVGSGFIYLVASFFNNTQSLDLEIRDGYSKFSLNYKGYGYEERKRERRNKYDSIR